MDGLTEDRITRLSEWRNASWKARKSNFDNVSDGSEDCAVPLATTNELPDRLTMAVKRQVIPQLMVAHPTIPDHATLPAESGIDFSDVVEFSAMVSSRDLALARATIELKRDQGVSLETIFLHLLVPAARRLSDLWESDLCHYEEVAVGMLNLQQLLHDLSSSFSSERPHRPCDRKALLLSAPGEQNMLGVFMVTEFYRCMASEFFHREGWEVSPVPAMSLPQLMAVVSSQWFDIIEVSATCGARLPLLATDLAKIKRASRNAGVGLIVCGPAFDDHPGLLSQMGADSWAHDASESVVQAGSFIERRDRRMV